MKARPKTDRVDRDLTRTSSRRAKQREELIASRRGQDQSPEIKVEEPSYCANSYRDTTEIRSETTGTSTELDYSFTHRKGRHQSELIDPRRTSFRISESLFRKFNPCVELSLHSELRNASLDTAVGENSSTNMAGALDNNHHLASEAGDTLASIVESKCFFYLLGVTSEVTDARLFGLVQLVNYLNERAGPNDPLGVYTWAEPFSISSLETGPVSCTAVTHTITRQTQAVASANPEPHLVIVGVADVDQGHRAIDLLHSHYNTGHGRGVVCGACAHFGLPGGIQPWKELNEILRAAPTHVIVNGIEEIVSVLRTGYAKVVGYDQRNRSQYFCRQELMLALFSRVVRCTGLGDAKRIALEISRVCIGIDERGMRVIGKILADHESAKAQSLIDSVSAAEESTSEESIAKRRREALIKVTAVDMHRMTTVQFSKFVRDLNDQLFYEESVGALDRGVASLRELAANEVTQRESASHRPLHSTLADTPAPPRIETQSLDCSVMNLEDLDQTKHEDRGMLYHRDFLNPDQLRQQSNGTNLSESSESITKSGFEGSYNCDEVGSSVSRRNISGTNRASVTGSENSRGLRTRPRPPPSRIVKKVLGTDSVVAQRLIRQNREAAAFHEDEVQQHVVDDTPVISAPVGPAAPPHPSSCTMSNGVLGPLQQPLTPEVLAQPYRPLTQSPPRLFYPGTRVLVRSGSAVNGSVGRGSTTLTLNRFPRRPASLVNGELQPLRRPDGVTISARGLQHRYSPSATAVALLRPRGVSQSGPRLPGPGAIVQHTPVSQPEQRQARVNPPTMTQFPVGMFGVPPRFHQNPVTSSSYTLLPPQARQGMTPSTAIPEVPTAPLIGDLGADQYTGDQTQNVVSSAYAPVISSAYTPVTLPAYAPVMSSAYTPVISSGYTSVTQNTAPIFSNTVHSQPTLSGYAPQPATRFRYQTHRPATSSQPWGPTINRGGQSLGETRGVTFPDTTYIAGNSRPPTSGPNFSGDGQHHQGSGTGGFIPPHHNSMGGSMFGNTTGVQSTYINREGRLHEMNFVLDKMDEYLAATYWSLVNEGDVVITKWPKKYGSPWLIEQVEHVMPKKMLAIRDLQKQKEKLQIWLDDVRNASSADMKNSAADIISRIDDTAFALKQWETLLEERHSSEGLVHAQDKSGTVPEIKIGKFEGYGGEWTIFEFLENFERVYANRVPRKTDRSTLLYNNMLSDEIKAELRDYKDDYSALVAHLKINYGKVSRIIMAQLDKITKIKCSNAKSDKEKARYLKTFQYKVKCLVSQLPGMVPLARKGVKKFVYSSRVNAIIQGIPFNNLGDDGKRLKRKWLEKNRFKTDQETEKKLEELYCRGEDNDESDNDDDEDAEETEKEIFTAFLKYIGEQIRTYVSYDEYTKSLDEFKSYSEFADKTRGSDKTRAHLLRGGRGRDRGGTRGDQAQGEDCLHKIETGLGVHAAKRGDDGEEASRGRRKSKRKSKKKGSRVQFEDDIHGEGSEGDLWGDVVSTNLKDRKAKPQNQFSNKTMIGKVLSETYGDKLICIETVMAATGGGKITNEIDENGRATKMFDSTFKLRCFVCATTGHELGTCKKALLMTNSDRLKSATERRVCHYCLKRSCFKSRMTDLWEAKKLMKEDGTPVAYNYWDLCHNEELCIPCPICLAEVNQPEDPEKPRKREHKLSLLICPHEQNAGECRKILKEKLPFYDGNIKSTFLIRPGSNAYKECLEELGRSSGSEDSVYSVVMQQNQERYNKKNKQSKPEPRVEKDRCFDTSTGGSIQTNEVTGTNSLIKESKDAALYYLQQIQIQDHHVVLFSDTGSSGGCIVGSLAEKWQLQVLDPHCQIIVGCGNNIVLTSYGTYLLNIGPTSAGQYHQISCIGLDSITGPLPTYHLSDAAKDAIEYDKNHDSLIQGEDLPEYVGGKGATILLGINNPLLLPQVLFTHPCGLIIARTQLKDRFGSTIVFAGTHSSFTRAEESWGFNRPGKSNRTQLMHLASMKHPIFSQTFLAYRNSIRVDSLSYTNCFEATEDALVEPLTRRERCIEANRVWAGLDCPDRTDQGPSVHFPGPAQGKSVRFSEKISYKDPEGKVNSLEENLLKSTEDMSDFNFQIEDFSTNVERSSRMNFLDSSVIGEALLHCKPRLPDDTDDESEDSDNTVLPDDLECTKKTFCGNFNSNHMLPEDSPKLYCPPEIWDQYQDNEVMVTDSTIKPLNYFGNALEHNENLARRNEHCDLEEDIYVQRVLEGRDLKELNQDSTPGRRLHIDKEYLMKVGLYDDQDAGHKCVKCSCVVNNKDGSSPIRSQKIQKMVRDWEDVEDTGTVVDYRCPKCQSCPECLKGGKTRSRSIREEDEQGVINKSIRIVYGDPENVDDPGRTYVRLPWIRDPAELAKIWGATDNFRQAKAVLMQQLKHGDEAKADLNKFMEGICGTNFAVPVDTMSEELQQFIWNAPIRHYFVWRGVWKLSSITTPCRVVVDPLSTHLNEFLAKGVNTLQNMQSLLLNFRVNRASSAFDIKKMYNQLYMETEEYPFMLFLWVDGLNPANPIRVYCFLRAMYGIVSSGNQSETSIRMSADHFQDKYPLGAVAIKRQVYVDDGMVASRDKLILAITLVQAFKILTACGFGQIKCLTLNGDTELSDKASDDGESVGICGLRWFPAEDKLSLAPTEMNFSKSVRGKKEPNPHPVVKGEDIDEHILPAILTRKHCVAMTAGLFDISGIIEPIKARFKLDLSKLIDEKLDWQDPVPPHLIEDWIGPNGNFALIQNSRLIKWNRLVMPIDAVDTKIRLLDVHDGSEKMSSAGVWAGMKRRDGSWSCQLLYARSKLTRMTVPRNELISSLYGAYGLYITGEVIGDDLHSMVSVGDSACALAWESNPDARLKQWVFRRVRAIKRLIPDVPRLHVPGVLNPTDIATKGKVDMNDIGPDSPWIAGLPWMRLDLEQMMDSNGGVLKTYDQVCRTLSESERKAYKDELLPDFDINAMYLDYKKYHIMHQSCDQEITDRTDQGPSALSPDHRDSDESCTAGIFSSLVDRGRGETWLKYHNDYNAAVHSLSTKKRSIPAQLILNPVYLGWKVANQRLALVYKFLTETTHATHQRLAIEIQREDRIKPRENDRTFNVARSELTHERLLANCRRCNGPQHGDAINAGYADRLHGRVKETDEFEIKKRNDTPIEIKGFTESKFKVQMLEHVRIHAKKIKRKVKSVNKSKDLKRDVEKAMEIERAIEEKRLQRIQSVLGDKVVQLHDEDVHAAMYYYIRKTSEDFSRRAPRKLKAECHQDSQGIWYTNKRLATREELEFHDMVLPFLDTPTIKFLVPAVLADHPVVFAMLISLHWYQLPHRGVQAHVRAISQICHFKNARYLLYQIKSTCLKCRTLENQCIEQEISNLHPTRLLVAPPFYSIQIDAMSPLYAYSAHNHRAILTLYALVIVCNITGATAAYVLEREDTGSIVKAILRHSFRYGFPRNYMHDLQSALTVAGTLKMDIRDMESSLNRDYGMVALPKATQAHGSRGKVERTIREIRKMINAKDLSSYRQSIISWETTLGALTNDINNLPLARTEVSTQSNRGEFEILTRNRLLLGRNNYRSPDGKFSVDGNPMKLLENILEINTYFYLTIVRNLAEWVPQPKWHRNTRDCNTGDVVAFRFKEGAMVEIWRLGVIGNKLSKEGGPGKWEVKYKNLGDVEYTVTPRSSREITVVHRIGELDYNTEDAYLEITADIAYSEDVNEN